MEKIVIIGSSGAGKSTLARTLGPVLNMNVFHLDRLLWQRDWKELAEYERRETLKDLIAGEENQWIIEGNYLRFAKFHVEAADTIIFLDIPLLICCWHLLKRHREYYRCSRYDIPEGCIDRLNFLRMVRVLTFRLHGRRTIEQTLGNYEYKNIIRLCSTKAIEEFLNLKIGISGDKRNSLDSVSIGREKILATAQ